MTLAEVRNQDATTADLVPAHGDTERSGAARDGSASIVATGVDIMVDAVVEQARANHALGRPARVVVVGAAGNGVSTVLRAAARRCGYPVRAAPAGPGSESRRGIERLLVAWLRATGVPGQLMPADTAALARLWVRQCAHTAPTLLIDDLGVDYRWCARLAGWCPRGTLLIGTHLADTAEHLAIHGFTVVAIPPATDSELVETIVTRAGYDPTGLGDVPAVAAACRGHRQSAVLAAAALAAGENTTDVLAALHSAHPSPHPDTTLGAAACRPWDPLAAMVLSVLEPRLGDLVRQVAATGGTTVSLESLATDDDSTGDVAALVRAAEWAGLIETPSPGRCGLPARVQAVFGTVTSGWLDPSPGRLDAQARAALRAITSHYLLRLAAADALLGARVEHRLHPAYAHAAPRARTLLGDADQARTWMLAEHATLAALSNQLHHVVPADPAPEKCRSERELLARLGEADRAWRTVSDRHSWQGVTRRGLLAATATAPHIAPFVHALHVVDATLTGVHPVSGVDRAHVDRLLADALTASVTTGNTYWQARALWLRATAHPATARNDLDAARDLIADTDPETGARIALAWAREAVRRGPAADALDATDRAIAAAARVGGPVGAEVACSAAVLRATALLDIDPAHTLAAAAHQVLARHTDTTPLLGTEAAAVLAWWTHHLAATALDHGPLSSPAADPDSAPSPCLHCAAAPGLRAAGHRGAAAAIGPGWPVPPKPAPAVSTDSATTAATAAATVSLLDATPGHQAPATRPS